MSGEILSPLLPAQGSLLCELGAIPDGGAREMVFGEGDDAFRLLLLRSGSRVFGYRNRCPHFLIPLNYEPDVFHVFDGEVLMCAHHTAMFHVDSGICFDGPCAGANLIAVPVEVDASQVRIGRALDTVEQGRLK
jgi:nitrite reductase/ring-hydroxylating ferredoxin subunit